MAFFEGNKMTGGYGDGPDIINSCTINVNKGEIVAILGPNGAGKSTAMKAMLGLLNLKSGNVLIEGILGVQKEAVLASKKSLVTVEEIVDTLDCHPNATVLPDWTISFISHVPGGAHPSYARGYYKRDNACYIEWDKIASNRETFREWMVENVLKVDAEVFKSREIKRR